MSEPVSTVCVWASGGCWDPDDEREALEKDIAEALGAVEKAVEITGYQLDGSGDGLWLNVRIQAPYIRKDWSR